MKSVTGGFGLVHQAPLPLYQTEPRLSHEPVTNMKVGVK